jgi:RND family efflux transporter MFP subunit
MTRALKFPVIVAAVAVSATCAKQEPVHEEVLRPVRTDRVVSSGDERVRVFSGLVRAGVESRLSFRVIGTVQRLPVAVGQTVRAGQLIAQIDPHDYELQVQEAEAGLEQARAARRNAEAERDRVRELYENDNASRAQWDQARTGAEASAAQVESLAKRLELARRRLSYTTLTAPTDGAIVSVSAEVNENVQAGQTIVTLSSGSQPEVVVAIPGSLISGVTEGASVSVSLDALPGEDFDAVVTEVGVAATDSTTFPVTVRLSSASAAVRPGMAAEVSLRFAAVGDDDRIFVPAAAVGEDRDGRFVFLLEPQGDGTAIVRRHAVDVGELTTEGLEVTRGLDDGAVIVTAGVRRLEDGRRVRLME